MYIGGVFIYMLHFVSWQSKL